MAEMKCFIPETLDEALAIMATTDCIPLAGGTDLMVSHAQGMGINPVFEKPIIIITGLKEMKGIRRLPNGWTEIRALSTSKEIADSEFVHPLIKDAASRMGAVSLRNSATIGGNIGNASPKGDTPQPLILLDAEVVLKSKRGERRMKVDEFIVKNKVTKREKDELIYSVMVPPTDFSYIFYRKIGMRRANAISKLTLSAAAKVKDGVLVDFRASSGAAGPKVARSRDAECILVGKRLEEVAALKDTFLDAWDHVITPHAMPEYRHNTTRRMLSYFIDSIVAGAPEGRID